MIGDLIMAWIRLPSISEATGLLRAEYDAAIARAGRRASTRWTRLRFG